MTRTQKRKLQKLCHQEKKEKELERQRDEYFNKISPMFPQKIEWRTKVIAQPTEKPAKRIGQSAEPVGTYVAKPARPVVSEVTEGFVSLVLGASDEKLTSVSEDKDDEQLIDYESSPDRMNLVVNVIHLSLDYYVIAEEEFAHFDFGPKEAIFQEHKNEDNHLKALFMKGHINGKPIFWNAC